MSSTSSTALVSSPKFLTMYTCLDLENFPHEIDLSDPFAPPFFEALDKFGVIDLCDDGTVEHFRLSNHEVFVWYVNDTSHDTTVHPVRVAYIAPKNTLPSVALGDAFDDDDFLEGLDSEMAELFSH